MFRYFQSLGRLRVRLAVIVALALAPAGVLAISQAIDAIYAAEARRTADLEATALLAIDQERRALIEIRRTVRKATIDAALAYSENTLPNTLACEKIFADLTNTRDWAAHAAIFDAEGVSICGPAQTIDISDRAVWARFLDTGDYSLATVSSGPISGAPAVVALRPMPGRGSLSLGVEIDAAFLRGLLEQPQDGRSFALLDASGDPLLPKGRTDTSWLPKDPTAIQTLGDRRVATADEAGTTRSYYVSVLEPGELWSVIAAPARSRADVFLASEAVAAYAPILLWLIAVSVAYFAIDVLVTRHVSSLRRVAVRIGAGELDAPVGDFSDAPNEIRALGTAVATMRDNISEREASLRDTLDVQRRLILEVHHRVKNNLQTISSLLNLESARVTDKVSRDALVAIQNRIHSLAMVHQNLYAAERLEEVSLDHLARDIAVHLEASLAPKNSGDPIEFDVEPLSASTTHATPIALFLSEAIGNAFKHGDTPPHIEVSLKQRGEDFELTVSNAACDEADTTDGEAGGVGGLGLKLMRGFAKQIGAVFASEMKDGRFVARLSGPIQPQAELFSVRQGKST